jgi:phosphoesterase RecJ-like protein
MLRDIEGVQIAVFFKSISDPLQTRFSLRCAEPYNAAVICQRFGGGGHARAAGASVSLPMKEAIPLVLKELEKELDGEA